MSISIGLSHSYQVSDAGSVALTVTAIGKGVSSNIFAIEVMPESSSGEPSYRFSHVCHPAELLEYPAEAPGDSVYFRVDTITCVTDTMLLASSMLDEMRSDVAELAAELNLLDAGADEYGVADGLTLSAALSAPLEFQFTTDGSEWHNVQTMEDTAFRTRLSGLLGKFSEKILLPKSTVAEKTEKMASEALEKASEAEKSAIKTVNDPETEDFYLEKAVSGTSYRLGTIFGFQVVEVEDSDVPIRFSFKISQPMELNLPDSVKLEDSMEIMLENTEKTYELTIIGLRARLSAYK